jgi:hypothetical protein
VVALNEVAPYQDVPDEVTQCGVYRFVGKPGQTVRLVKHHERLVEEVLADIDRLSVKVNRQNGAVDGFRLMGRGLFV